MKVVVSKDALVSIIGQIQYIVANKPAIPVISNVLVEAIDSQLIITATDLTTSMRCYMDAKIIEEGAIALPARRFFQLVRELSSAQIKIAAISSDLAEISYGTSLFKMSGMNKTEFPSLPNISNALQIKIPSIQLKEMLARTCFSAAKDDTRQMLNGIFFKIENQQASFIATDAKRLAKLSCKIDVDSSFQGNFILPIKATEEMVKILNDSEEQITLGLMHDKIFLENDNTTLFTKLLSGQYPDVEKVIPNKTDYQMTFHREELLMLLKQVSLFTSENGASVRFLFEQGQLLLSVNTSNVGEANVTMPIDYSSDRFEIAFNPFYFMDILRHSKDEIVNFAIQGAYNPGVITDSTNALFVIMPMRLDETEKNQKHVFEKAQAT